MRELVPVIIIDYFTADRTRQCIEDFKRNIYGADLCFVIVDNSNDENNFKKLINNLTLNKTIIYKSDIYYNKNDKLIFINPKENIGFAKGNNLGFKVVKRFYNFNECLFSNNDVHVGKFDIAKMISDLRKNPKIAVVGPKVIGLDGKDQSPEEFKSIFKRYWKRGLLYPLNSSKIRKNIKLKNKYAINNESVEYSGYVYRVIGAFMLCDAVKFEQVGGFDEHTFLYAEELILSEKLKKYGYKTYFDCKLKVVHEGGYSTQRAFENDKRDKLKLDSDLYYYEKYVGTPKFIIQLTTIIMDIYSLKYKLVHKIIR